jgi:hypothetical protein
MDYWRVMRWNEMVLTQYRRSGFIVKEKPLNELVDRYIDDVESFYSHTF